MADFLHSEDEELITQYLDGSLSAGEATALEERMKAEPALAEAVEQRRLAIDALRHYGLVQKVRSIHRQLRTEVVPRSEKAPVVGLGRFQRRALAVAASLLLLFVGIEGYRFYRLSAEEIYQQAYVNYSIEGSRGVETLSPAEAAYRQKDFGKVVLLVSAGEASDHDRFLAALAHLQLNNPAGAVPLFQSLQQGTDFQADAEFYLGLAHLKLHRYDEALQSLRAIRNNPAHPYHAAVSKRLLRNIKWLKMKK